MWSDCSCLLIVAVQMTETLSNIALLLYGLVSQNINRYNSQITASVVLILFLFVVFVVSFNRKSFFFRSLQSKCELVAAKQFIRSTWDWVCVWWWKYITNGAQFINVEQINFNFENKARQQQHEVNIRINNNIIAAMNLCGSLFQQ